MFKKPFLLVFSTRKRLVFIEKCSVFDTYSVEIFTADSPNALMSSAGWSVDNGDRSGCGEVHAADVVCRTMSVAECRHF